MSFAVIRTDDNGHTFLVQKGLTAEQADQVFAKVSRGHKQFYEIVPYSADEDFDRMAEQRSLKF